MMRRINNASLRYANHPCVMPLVPNHPSDGTSDMPLVLNYPSFSTSVMPLVLNYPKKQVKRDARTLYSPIFAVNTIKIMEHTYKKILPEDVFLSVSERKATEQELWKGYPAVLKGNRPTGCHFMDCFADLMHQYMHFPIESYAKILGLSKDVLSKTIFSLTGITFTEWRERYVMLAARELLLETDWGIQKIGKRLGFNACTTFSRFFTKHEKACPSWWRHRKKKALTR